MHLSQVDVIANQRAVSILPGCTKGHTLLLIMYPEGRDIGGKKVIFFINLFLLGTLTFLRFLYFIFNSDT